MADRARCAGAASAMRRRPAGLMGAQPQAARGGVEARCFQGAAQRGGQRGRAVDPLDGDRAEGARAGRPTPGPLPPRGAGVVLPDAASAEPEGQASSVLPPRSMYRVSSPSTRTTRAPALRPGLWPAPSGGSGQGSAAPYGVGRVGGGEDDGARRDGCRRIGCRRAAPARRPVARGTDGAQPVHRAVHRELGGAQPLDHIAAAGLAAVLEGGQHPVGGGEAALDALRGDRAPGDHAVPVEQGAGQRVAPGGWGRPRAPAAATSGPRPSAGPLREAVARPAAGEACRSGRAGRRAWRGGRWSPRCGRSRAASAAAPACRW